MVRQSRASSRQSTQRPEFPFQFRIVAMGLDFTELSDTGEISHDDPALADGA
jgi:hypothetical protein